MTTYKDAGVNVEAGYKSVELIKKHINKTMIPGVLSNIGGFGGMFAPDLSEYKEPVFVSGTDGVGTKLMIAFLLNKHDTIGIDAVAMCVNDIICGGAKPLFFLDYIACGRNYPEKIEQIVKGVAQGCVEAGCALIGGETAEMPGFYNVDEYDIAGFAVGIVDKGKMIDSTNIKEGDSLIGIASSGVHSNGFSLVRRIIGLNEEKLSQKMDCLNTTLGAELMKPTKIYVKTILSVINSIEVKGISHITGGGFIENIPRMLPDGLSANIKIGSWPVLPIFNVLKEAGQLEESVLYNTFNMGIGMVLAVNKKDEEKAIKIIEKQGEKAYVIGQVVKGNEGVTLC